jgi:hypothetical protein
VHPRKQESGDQQPPDGDGRDRPGATQQQRGVTLRDEVGPRSLVEVGAEAVAAGDFDAIKVVLIQVDRELQGHESNHRQREARYSEHRVTTSQRFVHAPSRSTAHYVNHGFNSISELLGEAIALWPALLLPPTSCTVAAHD